MVMVGEVWIVFTNNLPFKHNVVFTIFVIYLGLMLGGFKLPYQTLDTIKYGRLNDCLYSVFVSDKRLKTLVFGRKRCEITT